MRAALLLPAKFGPLPPCPSCSAALDRGRVIPGAWPGLRRSPRVSCSQCLSIVRLAPARVAASRGTALAALAEERQAASRGTALAALAEERQAWRPLVDVTGAVAMRRLEGLRRARDAGTLDCEIDAMRASREHRLLLRIPELAAEARHAFGRSIRLAVDAKFVLDEQPELERCDEEPSPGGDERWTCSPWRGRHGLLVLRAGWTLPCVRWEGAHAILKPRVARTPNEEPKPLSWQASGIASFRVPLDLLAPGEPLRE